MPGDDPPFESEWTCGWGDADPAGVAYYPRLVDAMHRAGEAYARAIGHPYRTLAESFSVAAPVASVDLAFERPVTVDDTLRIAVEATVGDTSFDLAYTARHADGGVAFTGAERHVCVVAAAGDPTPVPEPFAAALRSGPS